MAGIAPRVRVFPQWFSGLLPCYESAADIQHGEFADGDRAGFEFHILAFASQVVGTLAVDFDGGERIGDLFDIAGEIGGDGACEQVLP